MRVFINNQEVELLPGMTVRHALIGAGFQKPLSDGTLVTDEWGNTIGMDGALDEGAKIIVGSGSEAVCTKD
jgi:hypothetical protein